VPQRLRDVLNAWHRHAGQVHLDQRLLHGSFPPPVALDDGRLERLPQLIVTPLTLVCRPRLLWSARVSRRTSVGSSHCALQSRSASASNKPSSVSSTVPRTTRSRCPLPPRRPLGVSHSNIFPLCTAPPTANQTLAPDSGAAFEASSCSTT
jgi:hypothetical protein